MLANLTITGFLAETAGNVSVTGGGGISALNGAIATALTEMTANLAIGINKYAEVEGQMKTIAVEAATIRERLIAYIDEDGKAYECISAAAKLPEQTEKEMTERNRAIGDAAKEAVLISMKVAEEVGTVMETIIYVAHKGNRGAVANTCIAMMSARTCVLGALLNVRVNLSSVHDDAFIKRMTQKADHLETEALRIEKKLLDWVKTVL